MPIKCESCIHFFQPFVEKTADDAVCGSPQVQAIDDPKNESHFAPMIDTAREICDREGDGHFVYFEPKTPTAGAAFLSEPGAIATGLPATDTEFVQITRERSSAANAGGAQ